MSDKRPFLTAKWCNLALITYDLDPLILAPYMPPGCTADVLEGRGFASLVAFDFRETRVLGWRWPGLVNFPEINLRFYVRGPDGCRGVAFVRELVPSRLVAWVARVLYNEPYSAVPMRSATRISDRGDIVVSHVATIANRENTINVSGRAPLHRPADDSVEHFFKEHSSGYGTSRAGRRIAYQVDHPVWQVYRSPRVETLEWDFKGIYGASWAWMRDAAPRSVVLAAGSEVAVYPNRTS